MKQGRNANRTMAVVAAAVILAAAAGYTVYWHWASDRILGTIGKWSDGVEWKLDAESVRVDGFPFSIRVHVRSPRITRSYEAIRWRWQMPDILANVKPWRLGWVKVEAPGLHRVSGFLSDEIVLDAGNAVAEATVSGAASLSISLADAVLRMADATPMTIGSVRVNGTRRQVATGMSALRFSLEALNTSLPSTWHTLSGRSLGQLRVSGTVDNLLPGAKASPEWLSRWRDAGGALRIENISTSTERLAFEGTGVVNLDGALQPQGRITARVSGAEGLIDGLVSARILKTGAAVTLKLFLSALSGEGDALRIPVSVRDRRLYVGPLRVFRFRPVSWGRSTLSTDSTTLH